MGRKSKYEHLSSVLLVGYMKHCQVVISECGLTTGRSVVILREGL